MDSSTHPDATSLMAFNLGRLSGPAATAVEEHLATCNTCLQALDAAPEDKLVSLFRAAGTSAASDTDRTSTSSASVRLLPGYEILEELGRGGMGVVYKAFQHGLDRIVALKRIRGGAAPDPEELARFRREAAAVARLRHPNIVQIHDVGEQHGCPYLVFEFVDGGTLEQRLARGPLPATQAAGLVETLARAIHYAHAQHVVHRDLKPGNILLQSVRRPDLTPAPLNLDLGSPKITDFGLAKQLDQADNQTRTGHLMGTPSYMAPEQAAGRNELIGPCTDVYALGAILYEALTARPPFRAASVVETLELVRSCEPIPPARLQPNVPRDLQTICLKCLEKDPRRRYGAAAELADDLERYLGHEPIQARAVGTAERVRKWMRRRPTIAALVGLVGLMIGGAITGVVLHNASLRAEVHQKEQAASAALKAQRRAEANYQQTRTALSKIVARVQAKYGTGIPQLHELQEGILEDALAYYENSFKDRVNSDPAVRFDTALAYRRAADLAQLLGHPDQGRRHFESALELIERLADQDPENEEYQSVLIGTLNNIAMLNIQPTIDPKVEGCFQQALALSERQLHKRPHDLTWLQSVADAQSALALYYQQTQRPDRAIGSFRKALALLENAPQNKVDANGRTTQANDMTVLGMLLMYRGKHAEAEQLYRKADLLLRSLRQQAPQSIEYAQRLGSLLVNWGNLQAGTGRGTEARASFGEAILLMEDVLRREPHWEQARSVLANAYGSRGFYYQQIAHDSEAVADFGRAIALATTPHVQLLSRMCRMLTLVREGLHARAAADCKAAAALPGLVAADEYNLACGFALALAAARDDMQLSPTDRHRSCTSYAAAAMRLLQQAHAHGLFKNAAVRQNIASDRDLDALRRLPTFKKLFRKIQSEQ